MAAPERGLWRVWGEVRQGAAHFVRPDAPLPTGRLGQFFHGLGLPFHLVRTLLAHPATRGRYLRVSLTQAAVILALGVWLTHSSQAVVQRVGIEAAHQLAEQEAAKQEAEEDAALDAVAETTAALVRERGQDPEQARRVMKAVLSEGREAKRNAAPAREAPAPWFVYWAALLSSLQLAQWVVIALSRDYHTALSREASLLTGLAPEDEPLEPRVRLNLRWLRNKLVRRWRALLVFSVGVPLLWALWRVLPGGRWLLSVLLSMWGAWWFVVFTAGKSALAWNETSPREPWFLRGWKPLTSRIGPLRAYGALWTRVTGSVFSPVARVERQPWVFSGLALVRVVAALPLVKCFLRPVIPVAASHLVVAETSPWPREQASDDGPLHP